MNDLLKPTGIHDVSRRSLRSAFGNFVYVFSGSAAYRVTALILLSIYASALGPEQFGRLEQLLALSLLAVPLFSLQAQEAFLPLYDKDRVVGASTAAWILLPACSLVLIAGAGLSYAAAGFVDAALALAAHVVTTITWQYMRNLLRASDRFDVIMRGELALSLVSLPIGLLLLWLGFGVIGALVGIAAGNTVASIYAVLCSSRFQDLFSASTVTRESIGTVLSVSARLVPNVLLWWAIELSDRLILAYFEGDRAVGLYSAGSRVAGILMAISLLFYQVWQIPAISAMRRGEGGPFFLSSFRLYALSVVSCASLLLSVAKPLTIILFSPVYEESIQYSAVLIPALCLASLCYFFGISYYSIAGRHSPLKASSAGLVASVTINLTCIPYFGGIAAAAAMFFAYLIMCVMRYWEARENLQIRIRWSEYRTPATIVVAQSLCLYFNVGTAWLWLGTLVLFALSRREFGQIVMALRSAGHKRDGSDAL